MDREEVIKWLSIMKANLNSFPEVSNAKKIEALAEAIRLLKNEQSEIPTSSDDCISRKQAIVAIRNLYPDMPRVDFNGSLRKWVDKYKPYIECDDAIEELPPVTPPEPRWISDSDGNLPDKNGLYLVTYDYKPTNQHEVIIARFHIPEYEDDDEFRWYDETDVEITLAVTAWMPLPEPYREVEE